MRRIFQSPAGSPAESTPFLNLSVRTSTFDLSAPAAPFPFGTQYVKALPIETLRGASKIMGSERNSMLFKCMSRGENQ